MLLSREEREKFAVVEQMAKISVPQPLGDKLTNEALAYEVVASILESLTEETE